MRLFQGSLRSALAASGLLFIMSAALAGPPEAAAPSAAVGGFQQHYEAAVQLYLSERYTEALKEFETAYAVRQLPRLLINIGTTHRKLGEAKAALSAYEAYLRIEPNPDPEVKQKLDEALRQVHSMLNLTASAPASRAGQDSPSGSTGKGVKGSRGKAAKQRLAAPLKPSFAVVNLELDRLKPQASNKPAFSSITGTGPQDVWAVGTAGTIVHFDGQSWSDAGSYWGGNLKRLYGTSAKDVWAVGEHGVILHYDGSAWFRVPSGSPELLRGLWTRPGRGDTPGDAWAVSSEGTLLRFDGTSWLELPHDSTETVRLADVHASPQGEVWAVGGGGVIQHFDGKTLVNQVSGTTQTLLAVWSNGPRDVWAVGEQATILHGDGQKWSVVPAGIAATRPTRELSGGGKLTPGNDLLGVWSSGATTWIVGGPEFPSEGFILRSSGSGFTPAVSAVASRLLCIWGSGPRDIWTAGEKGLLMHFDGTTWTPVPRKTTEALNSLWGSGPADVWAAGDSGTLLHYDGQAWSVAFTRSDGALYRVFRSGPRELWATGYGHLRHFDGATWQSVNVGSPATLTAGWASDATHVWLAGESGTIMRYEIPFSGSHRCYELRERRGIDCGSIPRAHQLVARRSKPPRSERSPGPAPLPRPSSRNFCSARS